MKAPYTTTEELSLAECDRTLKAELRRNKITDKRRAITNTIIPGAILCSIAAFAIISSLIFFKWMPKSLPLGISVLAPFTPLALFSLYTTKKLLNTDKDLSKNSPLPTFSTHSISTAQQTYTERTALEQADKVLYSTLLRLSNQAKSVETRGVVCVFSGSIASVVAISLLIVAFFVNPPTPIVSKPDLIEKASLMSPAILIELLSFYFLRLFSSATFELRTIHNEMTNIESKRAALLVAAQNNDEKLWKATVLNLLSVERNIRLDKNQTTQELEKENISNEYFSWLLNKNRKNK